MKNRMAKMVRIENAYETWQSSDGNWIWKVLKKYQINDDKPAARWFCAVKSPFTFDSWDYGDVYAKEIKSAGTKV